MCWPSFGQKVTSAKGKGQSAKGKGQSAKGKGHQCTTSRAELSLRLPLAPPPRLIIYHNGVPIWRFQPVQPAGGGGGGGGQDERKGK